MKHLEKFLLFIIILILLIITVPFWLLPSLGFYFGYVQEQKDKNQDLSWRQYEIQAYLEKQPSLVISGLDAEVIKTNLEDHWQIEFPYANESPINNTLGYQIYLPHNKDCFMDVVASDHTQLLSLEASIFSKAPPVFGQSDLEFLTFIAHQTINEKNYDTLDLWLTKEILSNPFTNRTSQLILEEITFTLIFNVRLSDKAGIVRLLIKKSTP